MISILQEIQLYKFVSDTYISGTCYFVNIIHITDLELLQSTNNQRLLSVRHCSGI